MVSPFTHLLPAHSVSEIMLSLKMLTSGSTDFIVTAVGMQNSNSLHCILLVTRRLYTKLEVYVEFWKVRVLYIYALYTTMCRSITNFF